MFSPYYARARRRSAADPLRHCALNVALYGSAAKRWTLTERDRGDVQRSATYLAIGPSSLEWRSGCLEVRIDEVTVPLPSRVRGTVRVHPLALSARSFALGADGRHAWQPLAPCARVEVALSQPALRWSGPGYLDANYGSAPLEDGFASWHWSRSAQPAGTSIVYDVVQRDGAASSFALRFTARGDVENFQPPGAAALAPTFWRIARSVRADAGHAPAVLRTLEDAPFYARSLLASRWNGEAVTLMHESLDLGRFRRPWVQLLLPFRMPRRARPMTLKATDRSRGSRPDAPPGRGGSRG